MIHCARPLIQLILLPAVAACATVGPANSGEEPTMITQAKAIEIAQDRIDGNVKLSETARLVVTETDEHFVVTWEVGPLQRGPDFDARVVIDKATGEIVEFMVGS